jgi:hypothetical protein
MSEWDAYLAGHYVCLRSVSPENMKRKDALVEAIETQLTHSSPTQPDGSSGCTSLSTSSTRWSRRSRPTIGFASAGLSAATV